MFCLNRSLRLYTLYLSRRLSVWCVTAYWRWLLRPSRRCSLYAPRCYVAWPWNSRFLPRGPCVSVTGMWYARGAYRLPFHVARITSHRPAGIIITSAANTQIAHCSGVVSFFSKLSIDIMHKKRYMIFYYKRQNKNKWYKHIVIDMKKASYENISLHIF